MVRFLAAGASRRSCRRRRTSCRRKEPEFIAAMAAEIGATAGWSHFNVLLASDMLREAAALTTQITGEVIPSNRPGSLALAVRQPAGVVLSMAPWNAPVILGVRSLATPLACGNTVVMKTSEICPQDPPADRRLAERGRTAEGRPQRGLQRTGRRGRDRRDADRAAGGAPRELYRLDPRRPHHRRDRRPAPEGRRCWNSAARRRWSCSTTRTSGRRSPRPLSARS